MAAPKNIFSTLILSAFIVVTADAQVKGSDFLAPVAHVIAKVSFDPKSKQINLDDQQCTLYDRRTRVPCVGVTVNLMYTGVGVDTQIDLELEYILDAKKEKLGQKRLFFLKDENKSYKKKIQSLLKDRMWEEHFKVYLPHSNIYDKLTSIDLQLKYKLADGGGQLGAVLGLGDHMVMDSLNIHKECGQDNICIPDLSVKTRWRQVGYKLELETEIQNSGEDSYNTVLEVQIPQGVDFISANSMSTDVYIVCSTPNLGMNIPLQCEVGNPLRENSLLTTRIVLEPSPEVSEEPLFGYEFTILVKSSNPEAEGDDMDNLQHFTVPVHRLVKRR